MSSAIYNIPNFGRFSIYSYSRFNLSVSESDITVFTREYRERIKRQLTREEEQEKTPFISFAEITKLGDEEWLKDNYERFFHYTPNVEISKVYYLSEMGYICSMLYSPDGTVVIVGHATGLIQVGQAVKMDDLNEIIAKFSEDIHRYYNIHGLHHHHDDSVSYPMFYNGTVDGKPKHEWVTENYKRFLENTPNEILCNRWFNAESGFITALVYTKNGSSIIVGHSTGLIQMRHGYTGVVLCTLRNIQFPPKPVYALEYSRVEERICYAACMDGAVYRIEIPNINIMSSETTAMCIRADPGLESLNMQFYGSPGISSSSTPFITQRSPALSLGITEDGSKMVIGYGDTSIKIHDVETQEAISTFKVHKLRLQFIPKKLQRMHFGQVCAVRCHNQRPNVFASAAWDKTLRIWDTRCKIGCVMTFEGVDVCSDSIDLNRDHCITGSWQPTEALCVWDMVARKRLNVIRVQNRRPDVDGEYIYACRYWRSSQADTALVNVNLSYAIGSQLLHYGGRLCNYNQKNRQEEQYNRKGKYCIIGGSGTKCVEVINLHNRYIACSYPAAGSVLAVTSYDERIAFGGTAPVFNIVSFHDPKHEEYEGPPDPIGDYNKSFTLYHDDTDSVYSSYEAAEQLKVTPTESKFVSQANSQTQSSTN